MPLFSIITPVYNGEKYIRNTINSVLSQDCGDFEYIIVNDGSTDNTAKILDEYQKLDHRIKVVNENNQWIFAAMNNGCNIASGEYVFFVNADDLMCTGTLSNAKTLIAKYNPDVIWTRICACRCNEKQEILEWDFLHYEDRIWEERYFANPYEVRKNWIWLYKMEYTQNNINFYKRDITTKYPFRNDFYGADTYFNPHMANAIQSSVTMIDPSIIFFDYRCTGMNTSIGKYYGYEHKMFQAIMNEHKARLEEWNMFTEYNKNYLYKRTLREVSYCISLLKGTQCKLSTEEKIEKIMMESFGDAMYSIASEIDALEELESRVLSGIRNILLTESISEKSEWFFVNQLLDILLRYEKSKVDKQILQAAIDHPLNKNHLGWSFMKKLGENAWSF